MEKSISVRVMGREYTLRVNQEDEAMTHEIATYVDDKMTAFRKAFPKQPEVTTAVIAALAIAEELFTIRDRQDQVLAETETEIGEIVQKLSSVLEISENGKAEVEEEE